MTYKLGDDARADADDECEEAREAEVFGNECDVSTVDKSACEVIFASASNGTVGSQEGRRDVDVKHWERLS